MGSDDFQSVIDHFEDLERLMFTDFPETTYAPWVAEHSHGFPALEFNTRYLSPSANTPIEEHIKNPLKGVDPSGVLFAIMGERLVHGVDNEVLYYRASMQDNKIGCVLFPSSTGLCNSTSH